MEINFPLELTGYVKILNAQIIKKSLNFTNGI